MTFAIVQAGVGAGLFIILGTSLDAVHFKSRILSGRKEKNMRYKKTAVLLLAALLGLAVLTACTEQPDGKEAAPTAAQSCCEDSEKTDCCKNEESSDVPDCCGG